VMSERLFNVAHAELKVIEDDVMGFVDRLKAHFTEDPEPIFAILRMIKPILIFKNTAIVTRYEDVQEVLSRDDVFHVTYEEKMEVVTGGQNFFLGMQRSPEYERDTSHMRCAIRWEDAQVRIGDFVNRTSEAIVDNSGGRLDVVRDLGGVVPARLVGDYFGCPAPSEPDLISDSSAIFQYLFTDPGNDPAVGEAARAASPRMRVYLDNVIAVRKAHPNERDDVLGRCLSLQKAGLPAMDDLTIRNNLLGLIVGAIPTSSKCCTQALDELLKRPLELKGAQAAARADDNDLLAKYVFEALRFNPNNPGVLRVAVEDYELARDQMHGVTIPKGCTVFALTQSAMFDEGQIEEPDVFRLDRPGYAYMHFGYGLHRCFGQHINRVQIPGILKPLLTRDNLRRAEGETGQLRYSGPFPSSLGVEFDA